MKHLQGGMRPPRASQVFLIMGARFPPQGLDFEGGAPLVGPGKIWGHGAHFRGGEQAGSKLSRPELSLRAPPPGPRYAAARPEPARPLSPPPREPAPRPGRPRGRPRPRPLPPPPPTAGPAGAGSCGRGGHPPGRRHMLSRPERAPRVPAPAGRPSAAPPAAREAPALPGAPGEAARTHLPAAGAGRGGAGAHGRAGGARVSAGQGRRRRARPGRPGERPRPQPRAPRRPARPAPRAELRVRTAARPRLTALCCWPCGAALGLRQPESLGLVGAAPLSSDLNVSFVLPCPQDSPSVMHGVSCSLSLVSLKSHHSGPRNVHL